MFEHLCADFSGKNGLGIVENLPVFENLSLCVVCAYGTAHQLTAGIAPADFRGSILFVVKGGCASATRQVRRPACSLKQGPCFWRRPDGSPLDERFRS